jgi:neutral ceramidase
VPRLLAGAAEVDITPPPGLPKAGYSSNAHDGRGFRTRLRARVLHLRGGTTSLAIVQCDLLGGSALLQHLVARAVADRTDVPLAGLLVGATHTHAGPGQFLGTDFYNRFASNRSGFDPGWTRWLSARIAEGVARAVDERAPARLAVGSVPVWGRTRNRSHEPHVRNAEVADKRLDPQRKWVDVNPDLHVVRVDRAEGDRDPLAAMVVFSVHGTGIPMHAREYNADLWAYVVHELATRIEGEAGVRPVVGAVEGTHADVAPAIRPGAAGDVEAERIGRSVGEEAARCWSGLAADLHDAPTLGAALREVDLDAPGGRRIGEVELPDGPAVGAALVAGAHENLTPVVHRIPPFRAGFPKPSRPGDPHGPKWVVGSRWLQPLVIPRRSFPRVVPLQLLRLGSVALLGLPFEVTVASGRRIAAAVRAAPGVADGGIDEVIVSSVANEYSGYVATAEEYERQHYEGGHTLYGPDTQPFLAAHAACLAAEAVAAAGDGGDPRSMVADVVGDRRFDLRVRRRWPGVPPAAGPEPTGAPARRFLDGARFTDPTRRTDGWWEQCWVDVAPEQLSWHEPLVSVEADRGAGWGPAADDAGRAVDDQGCALEVVHLGPVGAAGPAGGHRYRVRWYRPVLRPDLRHRFVLAPNAGRPGVDGPAFD